jgi:putative flippase GtrA
MTILCTASGIAYRTFRPIWRAFGLGNALFHQLFVFGLVGGTSALGFIGMHDGLIYAARLDQVLAVVPAIALSFIISFWGHSRLTFAAPMTGPIFLRFCLTSAASLPVATGLSVLNKGIDWPPWSGTLMIVIVIPITTFLSHRFFTYGVEGMVDPRRLPQTREPGR